MPKYKEDRQDNDGAGSSHIRTCHAAVCPLLLLPPLRCCLSAWLLVLLPPLPPLLLAQTCQALLLCQPPACRPCCC